VRESAVTAAGMQHLVGNVLVGVRVDLGPRVSIVVIRDDPFVVGVGRVVVRTSEVPVTVPNYERMVVVPPWLPPTFADELHIAPADHQLVAKLGIGGVIPHGSHSRRGV
jgi:hypothetical protein